MIALLLSALISEIPWLLLGEYHSHNVLFTLLLGLIAIYMTDKFSHNSWIILVPSCIISIFATGWNTDYSWRGVSLMIVFFIFREKQALSILFGLPLMLEYGTIGPLVGLIIPLLYSRRRGFIKGKFLKYLFFLYYPSHLLAIWFLKYKCLELIIMYIIG